MVEPKPNWFVIWPSSSVQNHASKFESPSRARADRADSHRIKTKPHAEVVPTLLTHETIEGCNAREFCGLMDDLLL